MKKPEIDIEEDSTDIEVIEIDSDTIDGAAADSDAAPNIQNVSEENEPPVQPDNEIENTDTTEQTPSDDDFEIIPAEAVPDDYDNYILTPDDRKFHITKFDIRRYIIIFILTCVMVFCMYQIISRYIGYARERRHNSEINNSVIEENTSTPDLSTDTYKNINPGLAIDFDKLLQINDACAGWIQIPSVGISYPIVQGPDNDYYLHYDISQNEAWSGAIYLDYRNDRSLDEQHFTIYGHHMNDGSMFANLLKYDDPEFYQKNQDNFNNYIYIYQKGRVLVYQIFSVVDTYYDSDPESFLVLISDDETKKSYLNHMRQKQLYETGYFADTNDRLLTLYTCQSDSTSKERHMVHAKLITEISN